MRGSSAMDAREQEESRESARLLYEDTCHLMARNPELSRLVPMFESCRPSSYARGYLFLKTPSAYAKQQLENAVDLLNDVVSEAAFTPSKVQIAYEPKSWELESVEHLQRLKEAGAFDDDTLGDDAPHNLADLSDVRAEDVESLSVFETALSPAEFHKRLGAEEADDAQPEAKRTNPLVDSGSTEDIGLTFDTFVESRENQLALSAAKQVANGYSAQYNPLFIYGNSGLGKTHLLMAIKNYIEANDPTRSCAYLTARRFINDYTKAMRGSDSLKENLEADYRDVDVLILDDIQHLKPATHTVEFFFDTFNYLVTHGKQIVLAADEAPAQLGMDERIFSRMASGFLISIETPELEFRRNLVHTFYERFKTELYQGKPLFPGTISDDVLDFMGDKAGGNIRLIKSYVQHCLVVASTMALNGATLTKNDALVVAQKQWPQGNRAVSIDEIQRAVQRAMGISHADLIGTKRNREVARARHVAIWLSHKLTDLTYNEIGSHFGGRTHTTVMHSLEWVEDQYRSRRDRSLIETVNELRSTLKGA